MEGVLVEAARRGESPVPGSSVRMMLGTRRLLPQMVGWAGSVLDDVEAADLGEVVEVKAVLVRKGYLFVGIVQGHVVGHVVLVHDLGGLVLQVHLVHERPDHVVGHGVMGYRFMVRSIWYGRFVTGRSSLRAGTH